MVTEPVAVTTFPMALVSRTPAEDCAGLLCAPAGPGRTTLADRIRPAIICARIWFHSPKVNVFTSTLLCVEQRGAALAPFRWGMGWPHAAWLRFPASPTMSSFQELNR